MEVHNSAEDASGNVVQAGSVRDIHIHAPAPEPRWPRLHGIVPPRASDHQPRDVGLSHPGAYVLSGPAGVGKTQIAAEFARSLWDAGELDLLVWITASRSCGAYADSEGVVAQELITPPHQVTSDLSALASRLFGPGEDGGHQQMLEWCATTAKRWLIVVDGVSSVEEIANCLPAPTSCGGTVITTRHADRALRERGLHRAVGCFARSTSIAYLEAVLPGRTAGAAELAAAVGDLPLALAQAGAYIADHPFLTCETYLARLAEGRRRLAELLPRELPDDYRLSAATTYETSIQYANTAFPVGFADPLLTFASMLSAEGVPLVLFTAPATLSLLESRSGSPADEDLVFDGLATLQRLNLLTLDLDVPHRAVRMQPVLRRVVQERASTDLMNDVVYTAVVALLEVTTGQPEEVELDRALRDCGHIMHIITRFRIFHEWGGPLSPLTRHNLCHRRGYAAGVNDFMERMLAVGHRPRVPEAEDHPDPLTARHHLARFQGESGDPARAVETLCALLADYERVLGADHPHTLTTRHNLAYWRVEAGQTELAIAELEVLLADRERVLGADHPHTRVTRHELGVL
ncbi:tetratricopeptide repeat protein [Lentzea sp. NPDC006480]|uniref:tetratricopeptide repeat protein n=1 Tax=Lentzea sp. NPDC006480 TaxID=3157176 RepID=UPI0033B11969